VETTKNDYYYVALLIFCTPCGCKAASGLPELPIRKKEEPQKGGPIMYRSIMVPVDLAHLPQIARAIDAAGDLARHYGAALTFVSITAEAPTAIARNPQEFEAKLKAFAEEQAKRLGVTISARAYALSDPSIDIDKKLLQAVADIGADLVVMASHRPGLAEYFWAAHGAKLAAHTEISAFLVR